MTFGLIQNKRKLKCFVHGSLSPSPQKMFFDAPINSTSSVACLELVEGLSSEARRISSLFSHMHFLSYEAADAFAIIDALDPMASKTQTRVQIIEPLRLLGVLDVTRSSSVNSVLSHLTFS